jgi:peptidyl-tRNA hydrolase, PTH2 family
VRTDLGMSAGKIASQAGHAYLCAFLRCQDLNPQIARDYLKDLPGTKVCLKSKSLDALLRAKAGAETSGIPCSLVIDSGCPNFFDGQPIITAIGLGPAKETQIKHITRRFQLL